MEAALTTRRAVFASSFGILVETLLASDALMIMYTPAGLTR
jgi:hypothetical protein